MSGSKKFADVHTWTSDSFIPIPFGIEVLFYFNYFN